MWRTLLISFCFIVLGFVILECFDAAIVYRAVESNCIRLLDRESVPDISAALPKLEAYVANNPSTRGDLALALLSPADKLPQAIDELAVKYPQDPGIRYTQGLNIMSRPEFQTKFADLAPKALDAFRQAADRDRNNAAPLLDWANLRCMMKVHAVHPKLASYSVQQRHNAWKGAVDDTTWSTFNAAFSRDTYARPSGDNVGAIWELFTLAGERRLIPKYAALWKGQAPTFVPNGLLEDAMLPDSSVTVTKDNLGRYLGNCRAWKAITYRMLSNPKRTLEEGTQACVAIELATNREKMILAKGGQDSETRNVQASLLPINALRRAESPFDRKDFSIKQLWNQLTVLAPVLKYGIHLAFIFWVIVALAYVILSYRQKDTLGLEAFSQAHSRILGWFGLGTILHLLVLLATWMLTYGIFQAKAAGTGSPTGSLVLYLFLYIILGGIFVLINKWQRKNWWQPLENVSLAMFFWANALFMLITVVAFSADGPGGIPVRWFLGFTKLPILAIIFSALFLAFRVSSKTDNAPFSWECYLRPVVLGLGVYILLMCILFTAFAWPLNEPLTVFLDLQQYSIQTEFLELLPH